MATIYAKYNSSSVAMNPLDPDTWVGGVVPGPDDIARFYYYQNTSMGQTFNGTVSYTGTNMYLATSQFSHVDSNFNLNTPISRNRFTSGSQGAFTSSVWSSDYYRNVIGRHAAETQSNGNAYPYGANTSPLKYQKGFLASYEYSVRKTRKSLILH